MKFRKLRVGAVVCAAAIIAVGIFVAFSGIGSEAERVEADVLAAGQRLRAMNIGPGAMPLLMKVDIGLRNSRFFGLDSARDHYVDVFNEGMERLLALGVLEKRTIGVSSTNVLDRFMRAGSGGVGGTAIWSFTANEDRTGVVVTAKREDMGRWEELVRKCEESE